MFHQNDRAGCYYWHFIPIQRTSNAERFSRIIKHAHESLKDANESIPCIVASSLVLAVGVRFERMPLGLEVVHADDVVELLAVRSPLTLAQVNILENSATSASDTPAALGVEADGREATTCKRNNGGSVATIGMLPSEWSSETVVREINDGGVARLFVVFCEAES